MKDKAFLDTNILVYSFDAKEPRKRKRAQELISLALTMHGAISWQVIQEFLNVATTKFTKPLSAADSQKFLEKVLLPLCEVYPHPAIYTEALQMRERWKINFYDALIVSAALKADCEILYSEDLQHGQKIQSVEIVNPFLAT